MEEIFREIADCPGYFVSNLGRVRSPYGPKGEGRILRGVKDRKGYVCVTLKVGDGFVNKMVHHLVLEVFVGPRPEGMQACHHPDHSPSNNALSNLRWDPHLENSRDMDRQGRRRKGPGAYAQKISDAKARKILEAKALGLSLSESARLYRASRQSVGHVYSRHTFAHIPEPTDFELFKNYPRGWAKSIRKTLMASKYSPYTR